MTKQLRLGAVLALAIAMAAPVLAEEAKAPADVKADTVVATVNGTQITLGQMIALRENQPEQYLTLPDDVLFKGILDQLVQQEILAQSVTVETARDAKAMGVDGIFVTPPGGAQDITSCWDADQYPEVWADQIKAQDRAVDLPIITHPVSGSAAPFTPGLPVDAVVAICNEIPNIVGWKMTYGYDGYRIVGKALRKLPRRVSVMAALASRFHEYRATDLFDGTLSGFWNYGMEGMLDHLEAWDERDLEKACTIWQGGLSQLHEYVADMGRLHVRYKVATWLRGLIPNPFMRPPMPAPKQVEIDTIYALLQGAGLSVIDRKEATLAIYS